MIKYGYEVYDFETDEIYEQNYGYSTREEAEMEAEFQEQKMRELGYENATSYVYSE